MRRGIPEYSMRTVVNANSVNKVSRRVTAESRFVILVLTHDGFSLRTYKSSSAEYVEQVSMNIAVFSKPILCSALNQHSTYPACLFSSVQVHGMSGTEGSDPSTSRLVHQPGVDTNMPDIDEVLLGCGLSVNGTRQCLDAEVAEVIVYDTLLSTVDLDRVSGYLSRKYDLDWTFSTGPRITSISPSNGPTTGGTHVTILGSYFDDSTVNVRIAIGAANCTVLKYPIVDQRVMYNTRIVLLTPPGVGFADIDVSVFEVPTRASKLFQYDPPQVTALHPSTANSHGGTWISVYGVNFGTEQDGAIALVKAIDGEVACDSTAYISHFLILCFSPRKIYADCQIQVIVGGQRSSLKPLTITHIPSIYECWPESNECMDCCENRCTW